MSDETADPGDADSAEQGDDLPEELDVTAYVGPYVFPDIRRRRIAAALYVVVGGLALWAGLASNNDGLRFGGILLLVIAVYHFVTGWHLQIDQTEALAVASRTVGFPVGHTSAQLAWRGLFSRPAWRILRLQRRRAAEHPWPGRARRRRRARARRIHRAQSRRLVGVRSDAFVSATREARELPS